MNAKITGYGYWYRNIISFEEFFFLNASNIFDQKLKIRKISICDFIKGSDGAWRYKKYYMVSVILMPYGYIHGKYNFRF